MFSGDVVGDVGGSALITTGRLGTGIFLSLPDPCQWLSLKT